jgi:hypothetical protein
MSQARTRRAQFHSPPPLPPLQTQFSAQLAADKFDASSGLQDFCTQSIGRRREVEFNCKRALQDVHQAPLAGSCSRQRVMG